MFYVMSSYVILCLHTGPPFSQHRKKCSTTVSNHCYILSVYVAVGSSKRQDEERKLQFRAKELSEARSCEQESRRYEEDTSQEVSLFLSIF